MRIWIELADVARVAEGKLDMLGAGWTMKQPNAPFALGWIVDVPWEDLGKRFEFVIKLVDDDGAEVLSPTNDPMCRIQGVLETQQTSEIPIGESQRYPHAVMIPPIPLEAGRSYRIEFEVNGETHFEWSRRFQITSPG